VTLDISLLPHQKQFFKSNVNTMLVGGYGSGKSYTGTIKTIIKKIQYPQYKVAYYLPTYPLVKDIAFDKFPQILSELNLQYKLNTTDKEIYIHGYGTIIFRSMEKPETIVGYETAYTLIDEADILPTEKMQKVYEKILGRNRSIENATIDAVSTPEGFRWLYEQSKSGHFKVIHAKTVDNKFLPKKYIRDLQAQYTKELLEAYMNGKFVNLRSGTVYSYFSRDTHHSDEVEKQGEALHIGQDFNIGGCVSTVHVIRGTKVIRVDEFTSMDTQSIIKNLQDKYNGHDITIYPDSSGKNGSTNASKSDIEMLRAAGYKCDYPSTNPPVTDRVNACNNAFEKKEYLVNTHRCKKGTEALEQQSYDDNGAPDKFKGAATVDDYNDSMGYFMHRKFSITNRKLPTKYTYS
jgi:PBSX family phage terminase large subunit